MADRFFQSGSEWDDGWTVYAEQFEDYHYEPFVQTICPYDSLYVVFIALGDSS